MLSILLVAAFHLPVAAAEYAGTIHGEDGTPIPGVYVGMLDKGNAPIPGHSITDGAGTFKLIPSQKAGFLYIQPPASSNASPNFKGFHWQPRIVALEGPSTEIDVVLPPAFNIAIEAFDAAGELLRWKDFEALGRFGGQFLYAARAHDDAAQAATVWPVFGPLAGRDGGTQGEGIPAVIFDPAAPIDTIRPMFWEVPGYGKLLLSAGLPQLAGSGVALPQGGGVTLHLNLALAHAERQKLDRYRGVSPEGDAAIDVLATEYRVVEGQENSAAKAAAADAILAKMLRLRDDLAYEAALARIPQVRKGTVSVNLTLPEGANPSDYTIHVTQVERDCSFGVYEGSPYNHQAWKTAYDAGFDLATVLLGWDWTKNPTQRRQEIDRYYGISALDRLGYTIKAHGALWLQRHGILPAEAMGLPHEELATRALAQQRELIEVFKGPIDFWEAMNEPAATNAVGMDRDVVLSMMHTGAMNIRELDPSPTLVNSPHELSYGAKYRVHSPEGSPSDDYALTYTDFLARAETAGALSEIDIIGVQTYPGFHLNDDFDNLQGPAMTPADLADMLDLYTPFGKPIHITEFSVPSEHLDGATNGWWREPWNEAVQAEYAARVYTLAFANPLVKSIGWWDITDAKPSVRHGGLLHADGTPKPVFERLTTLIATWNTDETVAPDANGQASIEAFGGKLALTLTGPDGIVAEQEFELWPRWKRTVSIDLRDGSDDGAS